MERGKAELYDTFDFQSRVRESYLMAIERFRTSGMHISVLDGDRPAGIIHGEVWKILSDLPIWGCKERRPLSPFPPPAAALPPQHGESSTRSSLRLLPRASLSLPR